MSNRRGAKREERAWGVSPERCEWAASRLRRRNSGERIDEYAWGTTSEARKGNASEG
jgi:hypothetical protein